MIKKNELPLEGALNMLIGLILVITFYQVVFVNDILMNSIMCLAWAFFGYRIGGWNILVGIAQAIFLYTLYQGITNCI